MTPPHMPNAASFLDSHCHIQHEAFDDDRREVLARSLQQLDALIVVGDDAESSKAATDMTADSEAAGRVFATAGIHPHHAAKATSEMLTVIRGLFERPGVVALGEIGLDYHYEFSPAAAQREVLREQLELAVELGVPVVVHCREAESDLADLVEPFAGRLNGGVMHCFSGDSEFARRCLDLDFYISFAGNVTFPKAAQLREAAAIVPLERLLVETDSPYLAPQPVRGKRCEPLHVIHTGRFLAELKGIEVDRLAAATTRNARRLFSLPDAPHENA